ncbi:hypothetical protein T484DRAFT_3633012 [Baffinella frigidus]|nr:hypothetical protein T484DRAFT_3633012 [Cryptophyta sp. CCMP2293]
MSCCTPTLPLDIATTATTFGRFSRRCAVSGWRRRGGWRRSAASCWSTGGGKRLTKDTLWIYERGDVLMRAVFWVDDWQMSTNDEATADWWMKTLFERFDGHEVARHLPRAPDRLLLRQEDAQDAPEQLHRGAAPHPPDGGVQPHGDAHGAAHAPPRQGQACNPGLPPARALSGADGLLPVPGAVDTARAGVRVLAACQAPEQPGGGAL